MQARKTDVASSSGPHLYPDLVDGRVEGGGGRQGGGCGRSSRRSQSLVPESAAVVRRAGLNLTLRRRGFTTMVTGSVTPSPTNTLTLRRRSSVHKLLVSTRSDPTSATPRQCASCGDHPELCLAALGIHDAHITHASTSSPRRVHSLLRHHKHRSATARTPRHKPRAIAEEGSEESSGVCTPDSDVCTPDSDLSPATATGNGNDGGKVGDTTKAKGRVTRRSKRHLNSRAVTLDGEGSRGAGLEYSPGVLEAVVTQMRRMSI